MSPDAQVSAEINAQKQAALHYRANGGSADTAIQGLNDAGTGNESQRTWTDSGVIYPTSKIRMTDIADGTSNTLLCGETSSVQGRALNSRSWGGIQPWTWGYYYYKQATSGQDLGWLMLDHKMVKYPIGYAGSHLTNETPFGSHHGDGGANLLLCDGSVRFAPKTTDLTLFKQLATRSGGEVVTPP